MSEFRQVLFGVLAALLSAVLVLGAMSLSMVESGMSLALATAEPVSPTAFPSLPAGQPSFTAQASLPPTLTPTAPRPANCAVPPLWVGVMVQPDETLAGLAQRYGTTVEALQTNNCMRASSLPAGYVLWVPPLPMTATALPSTATPSATTTTVLEPPPELTSVSCGPPAGWVRYLVQRGDTLSGLSRKLGVRVSQIQQANCMGGSVAIRAGGLLWVPFLPPVIPIATWTSPPGATTTGTATVPPTATSTPTTVLPPTARPTSTTAAPPPATATSSPTATHTPVLPTAEDTKTPTATPLPSPTPTASPTPLPPTPDFTDTPVPTETSTHTNPATSTDAVAPLETKDPSG